MEKAIKKAKVEDALEIYKLIERYSKQGLMLDRSMDYIISRIRDFFVYVLENEIIGCVGLKIWDKEWAEIMALAVHPEHTGNGIGTMLIHACLDDAKTLGVKNVFILTFQHDLAKKTGFEKKDDINILPKIIFDEKFVNVDKLYVLKIVGGND